MAVFEVASSWFGLYSFSVRRVATFLALCLCTSLFRFLCTILDHVVARYDHHYVFLSLPLHFLAPFEHLHDTTYRYYFTHALLHDHAS